MPVHAGPSIIAQAAPEWDALFQRTNGWIGADGNYSVKLAEDKILWLFSDTWVGEVANGRRTNVAMINNTIGVQRGVDPAKASVEFFYNTNHDGKAASFFKPAREKTYFWPFAGVRTDKGLFVFLQQVENYKTGTPFGFRLIGAWLAQVKNPDDPPPRWKIEQHQIPFSKFSTNELLILGSAIVPDGTGWLIFGSHSKRGPDGKRRSPLIAARVDGQRLNDWKSWRFYSESGWVKGTKKLAAILPDIPTEFSVSQLASNNYALVYTEGINGKIVLRTATSALGSWSDPVFVFQSPEQEWGGTFCYAGKAHQFVPGELHVTYAANAWNFLQVITDARLYWPRFVRVPLPR